MTSLDGEVVKLLDFKTFAVWNIQFDTCLGWPSVISAMQSYFRGLFFKGDLFGAVFELKTIVKLSKIC